jgi:RND family efflux transporter MFP subunit
MKTKVMIMKNKRRIYLIGAGAFITLLALVILFSGNNTIRPGVFPEKDSPGISPPKTMQVEKEKVVDWYEAVGTVRPGTETNIGAQITAQVTMVNVSPGSKVEKNQVLLTLDNRQFISRLDQAKQGLKSAAAGREEARQAVAAAQAAFNQAEAAYTRTKKYFDKEAATSHDLEQGEAAYLQAKAGLSRAKEGLAGTNARIKQAEEVIKEAEIALGYTTIRAPESGEVLKRMVEKGDLALPGKPLVILQTSGFLRLEAYVREGLITKVVPGNHLSVHIATIGKTVDALVEEVVPYADPQTRTFLVKAALPPLPGLYPGMYGKLLIPVKEQEVVLIPGEAIRRIGQLELVKVKDKDTWKQRFVKTGRAVDSNIEILSGLEGGEIIGLEE